MRLTHRQIDTFRAVMATGNVTRAAEALHRSQPTVSRELARLEQVLQIALFERAGGRLRPTARALLLLEEVERSYVGLERIAATALSLRQFANGRLQLACLPALGDALLPEATRRFMLKHPQASVSITTLESPALEAGLGEQRFDLGLIERHEAPPATTLTPLLQADELCVLPDGHPLLARRMLKPADFADVSFVSFSPSDPYRRQVDALFERHGIARRMALDTVSAASVCALVRRGLGVSIVNPLTALELAGPGLNLRPLSEAIPFQVGLIVPSHRPANPLRETFIEALFETAAGLKARWRQTARQPIPNATARLAKRMA